MYADPELFVVGYLTQRWAPIRVCTETPDTLPDQLIRVLGVGGVDTISVDYPTLDVECFAGNELAAAALAAAVRADLRQHAAGYTANGVTLAAVTTVSRPKWLPYDNTNVRRIGATYQFALHNH